MRTIFLLGVLLCSTVAHADSITFNYVGNPFTVIANGGDKHEIIDRIRATAVIDFNGAGNYAASFWSITFGPAAASSLDVFSSVLNTFTLDAAGNVIGWRLMANWRFYGAEGSDIDNIRTEHGQFGDEDFVLLDSHTLGCLGEPTCLYGWAGHNPGVWNQAESVPEPSSLLLLSVGLAFGITRRLAGGTHSQGCRSLPHRVPAREGTKAPDAAPRLAHTAFHSRHR